MTLTQSGGDVAAAGLVINSDAIRMVRSEMTATFFIVFPRAELIAQDIAGTSPEYDTLAQLSPDYLLNAKLMRFSP
jgi:hypothetical protein